MSASTPARIASSLTDAASRFAAYGFARIHRSARSRRPAGAASPITLECARKIGDIMKYVSPSEKPQVSYSFYM
jgi:hypothetical protein